MNLRPQTRLLHPAVGIGHQMLLGCERGRRYQVCRYCGVYLGQPAALLACRGRQR